MAKTDVKCPNCGEVNVAKNDTDDILAYTFGKRKDEVFIKFQAILVPFGITMYYSDDLG